MNKGKMKTILLIVGIFLFSTVKADEGEQLFTKTCTACHTIGKGRLVGPDLLNVNEKQSQEWLIAFIQSSTTVIKSGDKDAVAIFEEYNRIPMPDNPYTDAQVIAILNYIRQQGGAAGGEQSAPVADILIGTTSENITIGMNLFTGKQKFQNGGTTCNSCHNVQDERIFSSGTLAMDLSQSFGNMGSAGVSAIITNPPFPVMNMAFKNHPITNEEVVNLTAYLKSVSDNRINQQPADFSLYFVLAGLFVFISMMLVILVLYFDRKRLAVNHEIFSRQTKVVN
ncbi:MAG: c-type cytochrome [Lentimicrobium sp.]|jgi:cytochrome c2|nr:c-type cytochrome [Lentimicrobium sp.]